MLIRWARAIAKPWTRAILLAIGLPLTLPLGFFAVVGATTIASPDVGDWKSAASGFGGLLGLASAWARVFIPSQRFKTSALLFWATTVGLVIGLATAVLITSFFAYGTYPLLPTLAAVALAVGIFLLGATIGARSDAL